MYAYDISYIFSVVITITHQISTTMGIVFCVDYTSSMTPYFDQIRTRIMSILTMVLSMQVNIRIGLVKFRSISDIWITDVYEFTQDINELRQWLEMNQPGGIGSDGDEAVGKKN